MKLVLVQPQLGYEPGTDNILTIRRAVEALGASLGPGDIVLLPEHVEASRSRDEYLGRVVELAKHLGCHVVGGSHHQDGAGGSVNTGVAVDSEGNDLGWYEKLRPYANERQSVDPGKRLGEIEIAGRRLLVLICADFWFADLFQQAEHLPALVLVPALSVTRKPTPDYSRSLWRHLAIARAYEFGTYVGVSDWGHPSSLPLLSTCGVGGFADPTTVDPSGFFHPIEGDATVFEVDFDALEQFRRDRIERGFFWKPE